MALTQSQFETWLASTTAIRTILVEVVVNIAGTETTLYLSNRNYSTGPTDTPANTSYNPVVKTSLTFNQKLPTDGSPSISFGDIALDNTGGALDNWLNYIWANRTISVWMGDVNSTRTNFYKIYSGYVQDIASKDRNTLNISVRDQMQQLNSPLYSVLIGGSGQNSTQLRPLCFGDVFNITPVLIDSSNLIYMVHDGPIERIVEVRDNGVPLELDVGYTVSLDAGTFTLLKAPAGLITCSVQGERSTINPTTGGVISHTYTTQYLNWTRSGTTATITHTNHGFSTGATISITETSAATTIPVGVYSITVVNSNSYTITCLEPENLLKYSEEFDNAVWLKSSASISPNTGVAPDGTTTADQITYSLSTGYIYQGITASISIGDTYTWSSYVKSSLRAIIFGGATAAGTDTYTITDEGNGWYRQVLTRTFSVNNANASIQALYYGAQAAGVGPYLVWGAQLNKGSIANTYFKTTTSQGTPSGTATVSTYSNTVSRLIQLIIQKYGAKVAVPSTIDITTFNSFEASNKHTVGSYITSTTNVIQLCQDLAASVGAQFTCTRDGLFTLVRIESPSSTGQTKAITDEEIMLNSCSIESKESVIGVVKLNYCKNWTIQDQLLTGIPDSHKIIYSTEYLVKKATNSTVINNYNFSSDTTAINTLLVSDTPIAYVTQEATRRLNIWSTPRFIYKLEAPSQFLTLKIGEMVYFKHYRFGLSSGVYGQIVSIALNWDTGRVNLGILV